MPKLHRFLKWVLGGKVYAELYGERGVKKKNIKGKSVYEDLDL